MPPLYLHLLPMPVLGLGLYLGYIDGLGAVCAFCYLAWVFLGEALLPRWLWWSGGLLGGIALAAHLPQIDQVTRQPGLFINDGQGIVDLMGHSRSQPPYGRKLLVVLHLGKNGHPAFIAGLKPVDELLHEQVRHKHNKRHAAAENNQQFGTQGRPGAKGVSRGLDCQQRKIRARQSARGNHELAP